MNSEEISRQIIGTFKKYYITLECAYNLSGDLFAVYWQELSSFYSYIH